MAPMSEPSRYDRWRRRLAPVALFIALGFLAYDTCERKERSGTTIVLDLGAARSSVHHLRADVFVAGEPTAWFESDLRGSGAISFPAMIEDRATVRVQLTTDRGMKVIERTVLPSRDPQQLSLEGELAR